MHGKPHALEPLSPLPPTTPRGSASGLCALFASARNAGRPSACQRESQTVLSRPWPVLLAQQGVKTEVTNYGWAESCKLAGTSQLPYHQLHCERSGGHLHTHIDR